MAARALQAGNNSPTLADRVKHAQDVAGDHPGEIKIDAPGKITVVPQENPESDLGFRKIPIALIDDNPYNARVSYRQERVTELAASIAANGQETPGTATQRGERYVLAAGHYRKRALIQIGAETMLVKVIDNMTDAQLYEVSFRENHEREGHSSLDNAILWDRLIKDGIYENEARIAERLKLSPGYVNKTMSVLKLSDSVKDVLRQAGDKVGVTTIYELVLFEQAAGAEPATELAKQVITGEIGRNFISAARSQLQTPSPRKSHETSRQYKIYGAEKNQLGVIKEWDNGRVSFDVTFTDPEDRVSLIALLKERYAIPNS